MISSATLALANHHASQFASAQPFRHVVIEDFFEPTIAHTLLTDFPGFDRQYALNEMGEVGGKAVRMNVREISDLYRRVDEYIQGREFLDYVSRVTGIPDLLYDVDYVGGGTHENIEGQSLDMHVDFNYHPGTRWHRRLNLIVYLNPEWEEHWGGTLKLDADPWNDATNVSKSVLPLFNRCVIFETTESSWHGFDRITLPADRKDLSRRSFAIYLYTRERPAAETAPSHATVYVPDGMPAGLTAGTTLTDADVLMLQQRFDNLRGQMRFLYEREKHFAGRIATLEHVLAEANAALRAPVGGYLTQPAPVTGWWPDGWAGKDVAFTLTPQVDADAFTLVLRAPAGLGAAQRVSIDIDGQVSEADIAPGRTQELTVERAMSAGTAVQVRVRARDVEGPAARGGQDARELAWFWVDAHLHHTGRTPPSRGALRRLLGR
jgi:hypothetical protein